MLHYCELIKLQIDFVSLPCDHVLILKRLCHRNGLALCVANKLMTVNSTCYH